MLQSQPHGHPDVTTLGQPPAPGASTCHPDGWVMSASPAGPAPHCPQASGIIHPRGLLAGL